MVIPLGNDAFTDSTAADEQIQAASGLLKCDLMLFLSI